MTNAELIAELRGHIREVPLTLLRAAADALEAAETRIAELESNNPIVESVLVDKLHQRIDELSLDCELFQQKCMELDAQNELKDGTITAMASDIGKLQAQLPEEGEWICSYPDIEPNPMFMYGICSICGFEQSISDKLNYCPNCGAKMKGEKQ